MLILLALAFSILSSASTENASPVTMDEIILDELEEKGEVRVIVKLKDDSSTVQENIEKKQEAIAEKQEEFLEDIEKKFETLDLEEKEEKVISTGFGILSKEEIIEDKLIPEEEHTIEIEHEFETLNAVALTITDEDVLGEIKDNSLVEEVILDYQVKTALSGSIPQIDADDAHGLQTSNLNITGQGETVCVIDTGIDYAHSAFGACSPTNYTLSGVQVNLSEASESNHSYANNQDETFIINMTNHGFDQIALHFDNISLEIPTSTTDTLDRVYVYDENNTTIAVYKGNHADVWTPHANGSVLKIRFVTDGSVTDYGFYADRVINGTTNTTTNWDSCQKIVGGYDVYNNDGDPMDDHSHGTHVAGIVASENETYLGVAPDAKLAIVKALGSSGSGWSSDVAAGIDWCTTNAVDMNISVISMSLGCDGAGCVHYQNNCDSDLTASAVNNAYSQNIFVSVATGNSGWTDGISNPGCVSNAFPVSSVTSSDAISSFSNRGNLLKLMAPGSSITAPILNNGFGSKSGTSMATPHVSGAAALLKQYWRQTYGQEISPDAIAERLFITGKLIDDTTGSGNYYRRIQLLEAIQPFVNYSSNNPLNSSIVNDSYVFINITGDVNLTGALLEWDYSNGTVENLTMELENNSVYTYNVTGLNDGIYTYKVYANDSGNTFGTSEERAITTDDATFPIMNAETLEPSLTTIQKNETIIFRVNASDSNLNASLIFVESNYTGTATNHTMTLESEDTYNYTIPGTNLTSNTNISYQFYVGDLAGNINASEIFSFYVYNQLMTSATIDFPSNGTQLEVGNSSRFNGSAVDPDNDALTYTWIWADQTTNGSSENTTHTFNLTGDYTVILNVSDANGSSKQTNVTVVVNDTTAPSVTSLTEDTSIHIESDGVNQTVQLIAFDYGNVSNLTLYYNGTKVETNQSSLAEANWTFGSFEKAKTENYTILYIDNSTQLNNITRSYSFSVTSCSDEVENGDEAGIDCGGSCTNACSSSSSSGGSSSSSGGSSSSTSSSTESATTSTESTEEVVEETTEETTEEIVEELELAEEEVPQTITLTETTVLQSFTSSSEKEMSVVFEDAGLAVKKVNFFADTRAETSLTIKSFLTAPSKINEAEGAYQYLEISFDGLSNENLDKAEIEFIVDRVWLSNNDFSENNVELLMFEEGQWITLKTKKESEDAFTITYSAKPEHFSYFVITSSPNAGILSGLTNLIGAATFFGDGQTLNDAIKDNIPYLFALVGLIVVLMLLFIVARKSHFVSKRSKDHFHKEFEEEYLEYDDY